ncbi:hypothetical protein [Alkalicoccobacillus porphyridii]|uniref:Uncharacterized protein n=1 Tax=Alkalicoccobacillus porphyridii TaxID=2597270 RepID=A0A554A4D9_9BACI|nr:hypothetical protein [Alkalicoccobacillus porphyridii]TSB48559.1 hypothetical protein FN960_03115 [Alkalicoccobacillus porphyridii]
MNVEEMNLRYEEIIHSNRPEEIKQNQLEILLVYMEGVYSIPRRKNEEWERNNREVAQLYKKIVKKCSSV